MKRPELAAVLTRLLVDSERTRKVSLDRIGEAIGTHAVSTDEIESLFSALEARGRTVVAQSGGDGERLLKQVVSAARELKQDATRRITIDDVAQHAGITREQVISALALLHIMQR
jgi:2-hydroxychromene-2-carboxylate isomerase